MPIADRIQFRGAMYRKVSAAELRTALQPESAGRDHILTLLGRLAAGLKGAYKFVEGEFDGLFQALRGFVSNITEGKPVAQSWEFFVAKARALKGIKIQAVQNFVDNVERVGEDPAFQALLAADAEQQGRATEQARQRSFDDLAEQVRRFNKE